MRMSETVRENFTYNTAFIFIYNDAMRLVRNVFCIKRDCNLRIATTAPKMFSVYSVSFEMHGALMMTMMMKPKYHWIVIGSYLY